jgi:phosphohistidine swiveling domain-containing protein
MINPKKELFKWGPLDGKLIYVSAFVEPFEKYPKFIDSTWPDALGYFKNDTVTFITDYEVLRDRGEKLFKKYVLNEKKLKKHYNKWFKATKTIKAFENKVNKGLSKLSDNELKKLFISWHKSYTNFWMKGFLPELSNWGGERLLKNKILKLNKINFIEIFERLSAPEDLSFFQKEELEFMKVKLITNKKRQLEKLKEHQKKYYWLRNSYGFTKVLSIDFFKKELKKISKKDAKKKINEIKNYVVKIKQEKNKIIKKYKVNKEIINIAQKLAYCVWWQDLRKKFIFIGNHIITKIIEEIEKRKKIPFKELSYYFLHEVVELLKKNKKVNIKERLKDFVTYYHERRKVEYVSGRKAAELAKPYIEIKIDPHLKEFKGIVVSKGKTVRGKVKILLTPRNLSKMKQGDILVAPMTSPDYVVAMRKASAIITDEGGMTCHAAIVSRELGIPCIVGTKFATKILKDGDLVEVNADKGVVRIIKK